MEIDLSKYLVKEDSKIKLSDFETNPLPHLKKKDIKKDFKEVLENISEYQNKLYAENRQALLIVFQGIDASGKDSSIKRIFTGVNPQGMEVTSFKTPSAQEYEYNYLWRHIKKLPEKGRIGVFNRSHYENVMVCRVHPEFILNEKLTNIKDINDVNDDFFEKRYSEINEFEEMISNNGIKIIKFFLNISKKEQRERFIERVEKREKNWKFSFSDLKEREHWEEYQLAFAKAISATSKNDKNWYVIPCDNKTLSQFIMAKIIENTLKKMNPRYPAINEEEEVKIQEYGKSLKKEK